MKTINKLFCYSLIMCALTSCGSLTGLQVSRANQKEYSFENRLKTNESFSMSSLKEDLDKVKKEMKQQDKLERHEAKKQAILEEIKRIKN